MTKTTTRFSGQNNKHSLRLTQLKLELGLFGTRVASSNDKVAIEITGEPSSSSSSKRRCTHITSCRRFLTNKTSSLNWDAHHLRAFNLDGSSVSYHMAFHVLHGEGAAAGEIAKAKMTVVGEVSVTVAMAELMVVREGMKTASNSHHHLQKKLPIHLEMNGLIIQATLLVCMRLDDSLGPFENSVQSEKKRNIIGKVKSLTCLGRKNNAKVDESEQPSPYESDGSPVFYSDDSSSESTTSSNSSKSGGFHNSKSRLAFTSSGTKTCLNTTQSTRSHMSRNRSFKDRNNKINTSKQETLTTKPDEHSLQFYLQDSASSWKIKEFSSRDGKSKLKTNVFFASFDQRSEKASGESACAVLVALIAHWLHSNKGMPTRAEFNSLITQGSYEWRRLCNSNYYSKLFPDKHFDLETIIEANLRPLVVLPQKSYTGFFSPEKFHCLRGAMSFDEIWDEINRKVVSYNEPRIYIVSWNDHFFVLKVEADAYYIIDSLGARLFEGCNQAFMLKFDESSVMYGEEEEGPSKGSRSGAKSDQSLEVVCRGKECCKEFIKRFLAAIPVRQLEKEEMKWAVSSPFLHRQLQIDFHYSFSSSSSFSTPASMLSFLTTGH